MIKTIDLLRHGEPTGGSRYRGNRINDPLTDKGWQQMQTGIGNTQWDQILSSPLSRCADFAVDLAKKQQIPCKIIENLKEIGFGDWEGKTKAELRLEQLDEFNAFYQNPIKNTPTNAEPVLDFFERVGHVWQDILKQPEERQLIIAHAGIIRAIICHAINAPVELIYQFHIQNGRITQIQINQEQSILMAMNVVL